MHIAGQGDPRAFEMWNEEGRVGCLLLHGFPGSPAEVRELGDFLSQRGISVVAPCLPGHGEQPPALRGVRWQDWLREAAAGLRRLQERHEWVFCGGLSMGGALALYLAASLPLAGVAAVNPGVRLRNRLAPLLPLLSHLRQWVEVGEDEDLHDPGAHQRMYYYTRVPAMSAAEMYRLLRAAWKLAPHVDAPVLLLQSRQDGLLDPEGAEALLQRLRSEHKRLRWLETSGHNALVDVERSLVFDQVHDFIRQVVNRAE